MALASCNEARSPVELSLSPVYNYQFSSISKSLDRLCGDAASRRALRQKIRRLSMRYFNEGQASHYLLQTDSTSLCKAYSPTLANRTYVPVPNNVVAGNRSLSLGYETSLINLRSAEKNWSLPLALRRVCVA